MLRALALARRDRPLAMALTLAFVLAGPVFSILNRLDVSDAALKAVAAVGFDPVYGARPLKRAIQQQIENPLAKELLAGKYAAGDVVKVGATGGEIAFAKS